MGMVLSGTNGIRVGNEEKIVDAFASVVWSLQLYYEFKGLSLLMDGGVSKKIIVWGCKRGDCFCK